MIVLMISMIGFANWTSGQGHIPSQMSVPGFQNMEACLKAGNAYIAQHRGEPVTIHAVCVVTR